MKIDFDEMLNFLGFVFCGVGVTIGVFFSVSFVLILASFILSIFGFISFGTGAYFWLLPAYLIIVAIYGTFLNSFLYFYRLNPKLNGKLKFFLHSFSVPISMGIMMYACSKTLCYI